MLWIYLGARLLYRDSRAPMNAIGASGLALLVADPRSLFDPSFQMTFLCVLAIAGIGLPLVERSSERYQRALGFLDSPDYDLHLEPRLAQFRLDLRLVAGRLARFLPPRAGAKGVLWAMAHAGRVLLAGFDVLVISLLMQFAMALPMAVYAHRGALLTVPANVVVVPLTGVLTPLALLATALSYVSNTLAYVPALVTRLALHGITGAVRFLGGIRAADLRVATPGTLALVAGSTGFALAMMLARRRRILAVAGMAAMALSAAWVAVVPPRPQVRPEVLEATALDVGQGDSLLVVSPQGKTLLVDAGGLLGHPRSSFDLGEDVVSPYLWSRGIVRLDAVAVTHAHADHMGGMRAVMANFRPHELWLGVVPPSQPLRELMQQGLALRQHAAGGRFDFGGAAVEVLSPPADWKTGKRAQNNDSLVLRIAHQGRAALLEGDAERRMERLLAPGAPRADVLKVGHHGSSNATSPELLATVRPQYAVISAGHRNAFGYPRREVLARLAESQVATYRTDVHGAVTFYLNEAGVEATLPNRRLLR